MSFCTTGSICMLQMRPRVRHILETLYCPLLFYAFSPSNNTRVSLFLCRPAPAGPVSFQLAISSTYQTSLWRDKTTGCVNNTVISGLHALQRSGSRATPLGVTCSSIPSGYSLENCTWSRWLSQPRENFSIPELPQPWAVRSIINRHLQNKL